MLSSLDAFTDPGAMAIAPAIEGDVPSIKSMLDEHRAEFGFIPRMALVEGVAKGWVLVAKSYGTVLGFVRFRHRRDGITSLYEILVAPPVRRQGVGSRLILALVDNALRLGQHEVVLKCPVESYANDFYSVLGFQLGGVCSGKTRSLNIWRLRL